MIWSQVAGTAGNVVRGLLRSGTLCIGILLAGLSAAYGAGDSPIPTITLHYLQRPPYMMVSGKGLTGLTGAPSFQAFRKAGIPFEIRETPFVRQLRLVEMNTGHDCMIGIFRKPDREVFARFSKPVYRDQTQVILTSSGNAERLAPYNSVEELFEAKSLTFLAKLGYSYGAALDARIEQLQPVTRKTTDENLLMIKAIKLKIADYMIIAPEEAHDAIKAAGFVDDDFRLLKLRNMPSGEYRHMMCSKNVSEDTIKKLNAAIVFEK